MKYEIQEKPLTIEQEKIIENGFEAFDNAL